MAIDARKYLESVGLEIDSIKNRIRYLISDQHWLTDGEWKESVLRQILRRYLPPSIGVGRGFIVTDKESSHQIDILIYDNTKPILFGDGDLVFLTPDSVFGIVEVKSKISVSAFGPAIKKLALDASLCRKHAVNCFAALFAFEDPVGSPDKYLESIETNCENGKQVIDLVSLGKSTFIKYWHLDPEKGNRFYTAWNLYELVGLAQGYFINNIVDAVCPESTHRNSSIWFPIEGKESRLVRTAKARWARPSLVQLKDQPHQE